MIKKTIDGGKFIIEKYTGIEEIAEIPENIFNSIVEKTRNKVLVDYTKWLERRGYVDSDVWSEEPTAIDRYLKETGFKL